MQLICKPGKSLLTEDRCCVGILLVSMWESDGGFSRPLIHILLSVCVCILQVLAFYSLYEQCEQAVDNSENWLKVQAPPASEPEPLRVQLDRCRVSFRVNHYKQYIRPLLHVHPLFFSIHMKSIWFFFCILFVCAIFFIFFFISFAYLLGFSFHASVCHSSFL